GGPYCRGRLGSPSQEPAMRASSIRIECTAGASVLPLTPVKPLGKLPYYETRPQVRGGRRPAPVGDIRCHSVTGFTGAGRDRRWEGAGQGRKPAAHGIVQDTRRVQHDEPAAALAGSARRRRVVVGQSC